MTPTQKQNIIEIPGITVEACGPAQQAAQFAVSNTTLGSYLLPFKTVSPFLSDKPLHRRNRNKPQE